MTSCCAARCRRTLTIALSFRAEPRCCVAPAVQWRNTPADMRGGAGLRRRLGTESSIDDLEEPGRCAKSVDAALHMPVYYHEEYTVPLPIGHRFPMDRYFTTAATLRQAIGLPPTRQPPAFSELQPPPRMLSAPDELGGTAGHGPPGSLPASITICAPPRATQEDCILAHDAEFVQGYCGGHLPVAAHKRIGFDWSPAFVDRTLRITGGTLAAAQSALTTFRCRMPQVHASSPSSPTTTTTAAEPGGKKGAEWTGPGGIACNAAGGTHHAFADHGEGFCIINDIAVGIRAVQQTTRPINGAPLSFFSSSHAQDYGVYRCAVLDLDVHQGNGTASIFARDPSVVTLSMHGERNYPWSTRYPSTLDIDVPDGSGDDEYLALLKDALHTLDGLIRLREDQITALQLQNEAVCAAAGIGAEVLNRNNSDRGSMPISNTSPSFPASVGGSSATSAATDGARASTAARPGSREATAHTRTAAASALASNLPINIQCLWYQAGVDPLMHDRLGRLKLTRSGLWERNELVFKWAESRSLPVVVTMGGGYSRPIELSARAHVDVFMQAAASWKRRKASWEAMANSKR